MTMFSRFISKVVGEKTADQRDRPRRRRGENRLMAAQQAPAIHVQGLEKSYKQLHVLRGVDFAAGEPRAGRPVAAPQGPGRDRG
jgi:hypothetical protein